MFAWAIRDAETVILHEGLPRSGSRGFADELTKPHEELDGYLFYGETIDLAPDDARTLTEAFTDRTTFSSFMPIVGGMYACGGFHPDYSIEWRRGPLSLRAQVCFSCGQVEVAGSGLRTRYDLRRPGSLARLLIKYRRSRPVDSLRAVESLSRIRESLDAAPASSAEGR